MGNYCGKGNKGWNKKTVDDLDSALVEDMINVSK